MVRLKYMIALVLVGTAVSSCGLFHKSCNCPHFGKVINKSATAVFRAA